MAHNLTHIDKYIPPELIALTHQSISPEQFEELCIKYDELRLELTSTGELIIMPPTGSETSKRNFNLTNQLGRWAEIDASGIGFDSCGGFTLPNGAIRSPDASWVKHERWDNLTKEQRSGFAPICPDFVVELRSRTDRLTELRNKMVEYIDNGALLGWLIDPLEFRVYVYRPDHEVVILESPETVPADPLLPGFTLNLMELW